MIPASTNLKDVLRTSLEIETQIRLLAEFNMNRYHDAVVTNNNDADQVLYPFDSVVQPRRPGAGIVKPKIGESTAQDRYYNATPLFRHYVSSYDDIYRYWSSSSVTTINSGSGTWSFATPQRLTARYPAPINVNKIVIGIETGVALPRSFGIDVTFDGVSWSRIITDPTINSNGQVIVYRQTNGSWSTAPNYVSHIPIRGVRLVINSMNRPNARAAVIEISPRLENDLSAYLIDWSTSFEISDVSDLAPIGRSSSNTGSITLSNIDQRFSYENTQSLYYGMIDKNIKMTLDLGIKLPNNTYEYVRQLTMYTDEMAPTSDQNVDVSLKDSSKFLQEDFIPPTFIESATVGSIIWKLLDTAGFTNYKFDSSKQNDSFIVPYFWTEPNKTVWEIISGLSETTQTAVYFDEYDVMQIQTKSKAFDLSRQIDWNFRATDTAGLLANIETLDQTRIYESNQVEVNYYLTKFSDFNNGFPKMEVSWQPEDTVVLRSASIIKDMEADNGYPWFIIDAKKSATWPYAGLVNIEGEVIRYEGKYYMYVAKNGILSFATIKSLEEKNIIDKELSSDQFIHMNGFTGAFRVTKRGEFGTRVAAHRIAKYDPQGQLGQNSSIYQSATLNFDNSLSTPSPGAYYNNADGTMRLSTPHFGFDWRTYFLVHTGTWASDLADDVVYQGTFGTRIKFAEDGYPTNTGIAGLHLMGGHDGQGLYVSLTPSSVVPPGGWEVNLHVKSFAGDSNAWGMAKANVIKGKWYDLECRVRWTGAGNNMYFVTVYLDGQIMTGAYIPDKWWTSLGRMGMFTRSSTIADFDYLYGYFGDASDMEVNYDESGQILDLIEGGFRSDYVMSRIKYPWQVGGPEGRHNIYTTQNFFDEFTPLVHEMREYDITFDKSPVLHSYLYLSNESQAKCLEYNSNPFGAKFLLANSSRQDAILNGKDDVTFGSDNSVDQKMFVYGRLLNKDDSQSEVVSDQANIRKRGKSTVVIDSVWNQTKQAAQSIANWAVNTFGQGSDELSVKIFGNPLIQLGDLVSVSHPGYNMTIATHKYFVTAVNKSWSEGFETELTLTRARFAQ